MHGYTSYLSSLICCFALVCLMCSDMFVQTFTIPCSSVNIHMDVLIVSMLLCVCRFVCDIRMSYFEISVGAVLTEGTIASS